MGVITDATGRQLASAVGGIDTSGLMKDTTGQQIANNTRGLITDATAQDIAAAIPAIGGTVIPNPTGTPTDTLVTVSIGGIIYSIQGGGGSGIITVDRTDNTSRYAWLKPCDANGNLLRPSEVTILSIVGKADMSGAPPYINGLNLCINTASDEYNCKLYNTQTGAYVQDAVYTVSYRVTYIHYGGNS